MRRIAMLTLAAVVAAASASKAQTGGAPAAVKIDTAAAKMGIDSLRARFIRMQLAGDTGIVNLYTDDATIDQYGAPRTKGKAAIAAAIKMDFGMRKYTVSEINPIATNVRTNSDGSEIGTYHGMHDVKGKKDHEWGRYVVGFAKGTDGNWRLSYLMAFPDSTKAEK